MSQVFFYKAFIIRDGQRVCREGTVQGKFPEDALDKITGYAINEWKKPLILIELYEVNENGALVATSKASERINAVLKTHKELGSEKYKHINKARERREADKEDKPKALPAPAATASHSVKLSEWNWAPQCGKVVYAPTFATLKLNKGAFK